MDQEKLQEMLKQVQAGKLSVSKAVGMFSKIGFEDLGFAKVDHHRHIRTGYPEVIYCEGKTPTQVVKIAQRIISEDGQVLGTRVSGEMYRQVKKKMPKMKYHKDARVITYTSPKKRKPVKTLGSIAVICAGTSDVPVTEEAAITAEMMGNKVLRIYDVGVAGIHRLFAHQSEIQKASVLIVAAGMEGALPSVVGGLVSRPVIAVPTSVGYGTSFKGITALLGMLNSCASGITVVNIDNGFGAGYAASLMNRIG